jgi:ribosome biogenesis GTPase
MITGRVLTSDEAGAEVLTRSGRLRATWGGSLLVASARCPDALARRGDAVRLTAWPDDRLTVDAVLMRPVRPDRPEA